MMSILKFPFRSGNTISIFPMMMIAMMAWRPVKAIMSVNTAFKPLEASCLFYHSILLFDFKFRPSMLET